MIEGFPDIIWCNTSDYPGNLYLYLKMADKGHVSYQWISH